MALKRVLGIDPGISSVGWALIEENDKNEAVNLIDSGSVISQPVFEPQYFGLKNQERTLKRQTRRQRDRSKRRLSKVENFLMKQNLLTKSFDQYHLNDDTIQAQLGSPYKLRSESLVRLLTTDELSYAILHLFKRRGFYSSLKSKTAEEKKKDAQSQGVMIKMKESGCQTLGEYFWKNIQEDSNIRIRGGDHEGSLLSNEKLLRDNLYDELELIINKQIEFGNGALLLQDNETGNVVKDELLRQFRFQRPLKPQKRKAFCSLEKKKATFVDKKTKEKTFREIGLKAAHKLTVYSQEFIIRQSINNLKIEEIDLETGELNPVEITQEDREFFFEKAWLTKELTFKAIRKYLKLSDIAQINLEFGNKKGIQGNQLVPIFKKPLDKWFKALSVEEQSKLMDDIHMIKGAEYMGLRNRLSKVWKLTDDEIDVLVASLEKTLKPEYTSVSKKAIEKLLPELRKGAIYSTAVETVYGKKSDENVERLTLLPPFTPTMNPIVNKSVTEVRKVVNAAIEKYGKIDVVRLELARDMGLSAKGLAELRSKNSKQEKLNTEAKDFLYKAGHSINHTNIEKYKLWKEVKEQSLFPEKINGQWTYPKISADELFGATGNIEIEHLLPQSITGDNSFMNKSLCKSSINGKKGNNTPYDFYKKEMNADDLDNWVKHVYRVLGDSPKKKRFVTTQKKMHEGLSSATSLNDTRYIARELKEYLSVIANKVEPVKGGHTAMMRRELDLNVLLGDSKQKSRLDYRHHMVDALAVAMTSMSTLDTLHKIKKLKYVEIRKKAPSYLKLHEKIVSRYKIKKAFEEKFEKTWVVHQVEDKPSGSFDEETIYTMMREEEVVSPCGGFTYLKVSKIRMADLKDIKDIDNEEYKDCCFVTSKSVSQEFKDKTPKTILDEVKKHKTILPFEVIEKLMEMPQNNKIEGTILLKSGNALKKVKKRYARSESNLCHAVKNKEKQIIGIKKLGSNFCIVGFKAGSPRIVSSFEYLNNKGIDKNDVLFKGSVLEDIEGIRWKIYKFSGKEIACNPVNFVKIDNGSLKKYNVEKEDMNYIQKTFGYYLKNKFKVL